MDGFDQDKAVLTGDLGRLSGERPSKAQSATLRRLLRAFLVLCAALAGFAAGGAVSGAFFVSPGAGLAGAAEVVFYGAAAALIAAVLAGFAVGRMGGRTLTRLSVTAALLVTALFVWALLNQQGKDGDTAFVPKQPLTVTEPASGDGR